MAFTGSGDVYQGTLGASDVCIKRLRGYNRSRERIEQVSRPRNLVLDRYT